MAWTRFATDTAIDTGCSPGLSAAMNMAMQVPHRSLFVLRRRTPLSGLRPVSWRLRYTPQWGGDVRLSRTPTRGNAYQTLAEPVVLELVPVGG